MKKKMLASALALSSFTALAGNTIGVFNAQDEVLATNKFKVIVRQMYPAAKTDQEAVDMHVSRLKLPSQITHNLPDIIVNPNIWRYILLNSLEEQLKPYANSVGAPAIDLTVLNTSAVNAYYNFRDPDGTANFNIQVTKGLITHPSLTADALRYVVCHEVGHGTGGYPFYTAPESWKAYKVAAEGQSDFFAASRCMHYLLKDDTTGNSNAVAAASDEVKNACRTSLISLPHPIPIPGRPFPRPETIALNNINPICVRTLTAAVTVFNSILGYPVSAASEDATVVATTNTVGYPSAACRVQTAKYGSKCAANPNDFFSRPGTSAYDTAAVNEGTIFDNETCWERSGVISLVKATRPKCWFKQAVAR